MKIKNLLMKSGLCFVLLASVGMSGCATIVSGSTQEITFNSEPAGAEVIFDGTSIGTTPLTHSVQRASAAQVVIRKEGYKDSSTVLSSNTNGAFWGNIILGGLFGSTTDSSTGAMYEYAPGEVMVTLSPVN